MPRFASIDVGSNASRLVIVDAETPTQVTLVESLREPVRLGHSVFLTGKLDPRTIDKAVVALRRFAEAIDDADVERYRAVVTASARDAENAVQLIERVRRETGITLEAIDGAEEARLVRLAVGRAIPLSERRALLMDLGGGSLELSEVEGGQPQFSVSLEIGTVRLLESFLSPGKPVRAPQERLLLEYVERMLSPVAPQLARKRYDLVAGTGGNFEAIAQLVGASSTTRSTPPIIDVDRARTLLRRLADLGDKERERTFDLRADRADVIVPALYVLVAVADAARAREVVVPQVGLKDGIVTELVDKHFRVWDYVAEADTVANAAIQLGRRYHFDEAHAINVARTSTELFDQLHPLHGLGPRDKQLLRLAALLHDVGDFIHFASHHKHTQYVIEHSDVMGLSPMDRVYVGCIARYHRRAMPTTSHASFKQLDPDRRARVRKLAGILRIADALDREHLGKLKKVRAELGPTAVKLHVRGEGDIALELWTVARKRLLFEQAFRKELVVVEDA